MSTAATPTHQHPRSHSRLMRAAQIVAPGRAELVEIPIPEPGENQVRIRLQGCGVCGSNIPVWEGRDWFQYPLAPGNPGHEGYGTIDALGANVTHFHEGQRVVALSYHAFAQHDIADAGNVIPVPGDAPGIILGEPLGCAINVARRCGFAPGQTVAVVGIGFLGALVCQLASRAIGPGGRLIAVSRREDSLRIAKDCGAHDLVPFPDLSTAREHMQTLLQGRLCDVVVEATGLQAPLDLAAEFVKERGRLVISGYHQDGARTVNMQLWNWRGFDVINAHERHPAVFTEGMRLAVDAVRTGALRPEPLLTHRFPLHQIAEAFEAARTRPAGFLKAVVLTDGADQ